MTDDIVTRLRGRIHDPETWNALVDDAADEIERLRRDRIEDWSVVCERQRVEIERLRAEIERKDSLANQAVPLLTAEIERLKGENAELKAQVADFNDMLRMMDPSQQ